MDVVDYFLFEVAGMCSDTAAEIGVVGYGLYSSANHLVHRLIDARLFLLFVPCGQVSMA
jgi:hypothetical protein